MKTSAKTSSDRHAALAIRRAVAALVVGSLFASAHEAAAIGFRLPNQDPEAIARGNAFVATADNPSAIYYNPAGITQLEGNNLSAGLYLISTGVKFEGDDGHTDESKQRFQSVPQFYYVYSPTNLPFSFGLGVYVPYGLGVDYGNNNSFRNVAQNGSILYATLNPVMAWKVTPELSLAIGPTINYSKADFNRAFPSLLPGVLPEGQFHFVGDDIDYGFNAGVRYQPCDMIAFGANYHYMTTMKYQGHASTAPDPYTASSSASATLRFPQYAAAGISFRPTPDWNIEFDLDWTDFDNVNQIQFNGTAGGAAIPNFPLNYHSTLMYEFGVTRQLPRGYFVSAGYIYSESSSPDADFNPIISDSNLSLFSLGFGHHGEHWGWAASYTLAVNPSRHVEGSSNGTAVDGEYHTMNHAINLSASLKF